MGSRIGLDIRNKQVSTKLVFPQTFHTFFVITEDSLALTRRLEELLLIKGVGKYDFFPEVVEEIDTTLISVGLNVKRSSHLTFGKKAHFPQNVKLFF